MSLEIPRIHLNGTSKKSLLADLEKAHAAIREAVNALAQTAPNGRDYYVQPNWTGAYAKAQSEHCARIQKLLDVKAELEELAEGIYAQ